MRTSTHRKYRKLVEGDLEIMPLMNLFVAMVPLLLLSAVFVNVTVIDMKAPAEAEAAPAPVEPRDIALSVTIRDESFIVECAGAPARVIARSEPDAPVRLAGALAEIAGRYPDNRDIVIISQPRTRYGDIVTVMDISREAGLPSVSLLGEN
jgi:biopolymer transport protein ExbD